MALPAGKLLPVILIVDDQSGYAQRMIARLKWRGFKEENLYHEKDASKAVTFLENAWPEEVLGVLTDEVNGNISPTKGVQVILAARKLNPDMLNLLVSSEDRTQEPEFQAAGLLETDFSRKFEHKRIGAYFLNPIQRQAAKIPGLLQEKPDPAVFFTEEARIFKTLLRDIDDIIYSVFGLNGFDNLRSQFPASVEHFDHTRLNMSTPLDIIPAQEQKRMTADPKLLEPAQAPIFKLREFIREMNVYLQEIQDIISDPRMQLGKKKETLESVYKPRFEQDYSRFKSLAIRHMLGNDHFTALRDYTTHVKDSASEASTMVHGLIGVRDAVSESMQGFADSMVKIADHYGKQIEEKASPQGTTAGSILGSLQNMLNFFNARPRQ